MTVTSTPLSPQDTTVYTDLPLARTEDSLIRPSGPAYEAFQILHIGFTIAPILAGLEITDQWSGLRPFAEDGLPIIGSIDGIDDLFIATAHYRNGILLAPLSAKLAEENLVSGMDSEYFTMFGPDRFKRHGVVSGSV